MRKTTLSVSGAVSALLTAPALLLTATPGYSQALEEITVTARKTTESLQEVPLAITALSEDDIERLNLQDLSDITQQDTSVQFDEGFTPSDTRITIRGLSPTRGRPNAATLVDGIDLTSEAVSNAGGSTLINPRLVDVQRIEVVKGPQSALFGRSAFAGAIQYITKDPSDTLSGDIFVNGNSQEDLELRGSFSVPITDTLGVLINGYGWDSRGVYKNTATDDYIGGGDGAGGSVTFKWEPTDNLGIKWRTEYSQDNFDVAAQSLLNGQNTIADLSQLTPGASKCNETPNADGFGLAGPLNDGNCAQIYKTQLNDDDPDNPFFETVQIANATFALNQFFENPPAGSSLGQYDPNNPADVNQYNKTVTSYYKGRIPDADGLRPTLNPNYRTGIGADDPANADDYNGTEKSVFRTSLKLDWAINDTLDFMSNTGYLDSTVKIQTDIGKYYIDDCSANVNSLFDATTNPDISGLEASYGDYLVNQLGYSNDQLAKFAPCTTPGGDGINDASNQFIQDDNTDTEQFSQEFRLAWQASDTVNVTGGLQYWQERVKLTDINSTTIGGGAECYIQFGGIDSSQNAGGQFFVEVDPTQDQCANSSIIAAYYMQDTYAGRLEQPSLTERETDHYSAYGSLNWNLTERFTMRVEARYTVEDNQVTGSLQTPCLNGQVPQSYINGGGEPAPGLGEPCNNIQPGVSKTSTANGGQATGPSAVLLCGQIGRCDRLGYAPREWFANQPLGGTNGSQWYAGNNPGSPAYLQNYSGNSWWAFGNIPSPGVDTTPPPRTDRYWAPKATFEYLWSDDIMTYVSWSRGIKPGGFSLLTSGAFGLDANLDANFDEIEFEPERLDVWEIGYKTTLADGRVRLNGSFFYQDFKDKQVTVQKVTAGTTGTEVENISGSEVRGAEVDLTWQATENIRAQVGYTFLDTEYTDYTIVTQSAGDIARINGGNPNEFCSELAQLEDSNGNPTDQVGCVMSFNGNELERAPRNAWLVNLNYTNNLFDTGMEWYGEANYRYQDSRFVEAFNVVEFPSYSLTDLRFGLMADTWDVQLYINNIFDNDTVISGGPNPGIPTGTFGFGLAVPPFPPGINAGPKLPSDIYVNLPNPRIVGLNAKFRFGG
jgi:outer membrane receptor protein involved in Fe transport